MMIKVNKKVQSCYVCLKSFPRIKYISPHLDFFIVRLNFWKYVDFYGRKC